jgi:ribosomal protein L37AE/L43A
MINACPCCSEVLLRHVRQGGVYWFCSHCRQEMPNFSLPSSGVHRGQSLMAAVLLGAPRLEGSRLGRG